MNISCILLAAGLSSRFGSPKALAKLNSLTIIQSLEHKLIKSPLFEIVIVLGAHQDQIKSTLLKHIKIKIVYNKDYNLGQTSSFKVGIENMSLTSEAMMLLPVDFPFVTTQTITKLCQHFEQQKALILIPTFEDKKGHPPIFSSKLKNEFLQLDNNVGINVIAHQHEKETIFFPVGDRGVVQSFNTPEEFEKLKENY